MIQDVYTVSGLFSIPVPGSRGKKSTGSRIRIRNTDRMLEKVLTGSSSARTYDTRKTIRNAFQISTYK